MRWDELFADLELQEQARERAEFEQTVAEVTRAESATVQLVDRLRATHAVTVVVRGGEAISGTVTSVADQWLLLAEGGRDVLVPLGAVDQVRGLASRAAQEGSAVRRSLGLRHALRSLARDRVVVSWYGDALAVTGVIRQVGADYAELVTDGGPVVVRLGSLRFVRPRA